MINPHLHTAVLRWFCTGRVGLASKALAGMVVGLPGGTAYPRDVDDLGRCLEFLAAVPEARAMLEHMRPLSPMWAILVDHWTELEWSYWHEKARDVSLLMAAWLRPVEEAQPRAWWATQHQKPPPRVPNPAAPPQGGPHG